MTYSPIKITELHDLNLGGRDFVYVRDENLMFVAMSDMNITSRLDAYLTNVIYSKYYHNFRLHFPGRNPIQTLTTMSVWELLVPIEWWLMVMITGNLIECGPKASLLR